jgi:ketosteroid isomerase-like protein
MIAPTKEQIDRIKNKVNQAAMDHLTAGDAVTALSHYNSDVIAVSNDKIIYSFEPLEKDVRAYYDSLREVHLAVWDEMHITVINLETALVNARYRYSFTDKAGKRTDLKGVWTGLYVLGDGGWKIRMRHETFTQK